MPREVNCNEGLFQSADGAESMPAHSNEEAMAEKMRSGLLLGTLAHQVEGMDDRSSYKREERRCSHDVVAREIELRFFG